MLYSAASTAEYLSEPYRHESENKKEKRKKKVIKFIKPSWEQKHVLYQSIYYFSFCLLISLRK